MGLGSGAPVQVDGLTELVRVLKGPAFRDVNRALRSHARDIAEEIRPQIALMVALSGAPQAPAMAKTVRTKSDRVPVVVIGKVNPKFAHEKRFTRPKSSSPERRGSIAHGIIYGPLGGHRDTEAAENYYKIGRDESGGRVGAAMREGGTVFDRAVRLYLDAYMEVLTHYGFLPASGESVKWGG